MADPPPPAIAALLDKLARLDAAYFRRHLQAEDYIRPYVPGECWPAEEQPFSYVRVVRLERGGRMRIFYQSGEEDEA